MPEPGETGPVTERECGDCDDGAGLLRGEMCDSCGGRRAQRQPRLTIVPLTMKTANESLADLTERDSATPRDEDREPSKSVHNGGPDAREATS